jgi:L-threonylcarbamoyladenylate synthase
VSDTQAAIDALRAGGLAVIPTDTVYGLAADGDSEEAARTLYAAKGRDSSRPTALLFASVESLLERVPELPAAAVDVVRALLPGPVTLILPNPGRRFAWLNPRRPDALGVLVATSANLPGGPDPRRLADVPAEIRAKAAAVVDGGALGDAPSTVIDLTGPEPVVLREGALPGPEALARVRATIDRSAGRGE